MVPPSSLLQLGVRVLTWRTSARLRNAGAGLDAQSRTWRHLADRMRATDFGRDHGFTANGSYDTFRSRVPLRTYEDFAPYIERMKRGAQDVLWPGRCFLYAISSGTTAGRTKYLPITGDMLRHFRRAGLDSLLYYTARVGHTRVFRGRHLFLGGAASLTPLAEVQPFPAYAGDLSGISAVNLPAWVREHLYEPGTAIAEMSDWPAKIEAIAERVQSRNLTLLAGIPSWLLILAEAMLTHAARRGPRPPHLQAAWPQLECLIHGGVPIGPYADELRAVIGPGVHFHEVYPASEGFIATQDADASQGLRLMTDVGLFYEFLPMEQFREGELAALGLRTVPLSDVKPGVDYALVLTTPGGLCRYVIGDVVRFLSVQPPRLIYVGRTKLQLSAFGEHVIEKELTDALAGVCRPHGWSIAHFHVAPLFVDSTAGQTRGRHEWWIELKPTDTPPEAAWLAGELDRALQRANDDYEAKRLGGGLAPPLVRLTPPGLFEKWLRQAGKWGGQNKLPRCRSDRQIADTLASLAGEITR